MVDWVTNNLDKVSEQSYTRAIAVQRNPQQLNDPLELRAALLDFIADYANWDNATTKQYLDASRALTGAAHSALGGEGLRPMVADPFAGGGAIPLEALRVGADAFATDLNPVAVILNKVILEYIPKYGERLSAEFRGRAERIALQAREDLRPFYPTESDGSEPMAFIWARTILSEAPDTHAAPVEVPLLRSMWLANKRNRRIAIRWTRDGRGRVKTESATVAYADGTSRLVRRPQLEIFEPRDASEVESGTSQGGAATCPVTGYTTPVERVRDQLSARRGGAADARLICVVSTPHNTSGRAYRLSKSEDVDAARCAADELLRRESEHRGDISLLPEGAINHLRGFFNVVLYGMTRWRDLFTPRQALSLRHIVDLIKGASDRDDEFEHAVQTCLALALDRCADKCASVVGWNPAGEKVEHVFVRQALPMVWDFGEANILSDIGWAGACDWVAKVIEHNSRCTLPVGAAAMASATQHPLPDDAVDAVITDPPYYAAIPYADLSDFFYSWLQRSVGHIHVDLFRTRLTPKDEECVQLSHRAAMYRNKDAAWFETMMTKACAEARRITKPQGVSIFVFANKETSGWEAMLAALVAAGWVITGSWPIDTEMGERLRARNSAALASSVHLVCRPRASGRLVGDWRDVLRELPHRIEEWMPRLAEEGVVGADAIFACLGPALEVFSKYSHVEKANGDEVSLKEYLEQVWAAVEKVALDMIFEGADATGFEEDARLTAMWLWTINARAEGSEPLRANDEEEGDETEDAKSNKASGYMLEYDAARKIAQGLGAHLDNLASLVEVKGDKARLLAVRERARFLFRRDKEDAEVTKHRRRSRVQADLFAVVGQADEHDASILGTEDGGGGTVLDRVHQSMLFFGANRSAALKRFLVELGMGRDPHFWRLAQALSALYPANSDEKRWVDGVLARKRGLGL